MLCNEYKKLLVELIVDWFMGEIDCQMTKDRRVQIYSELQWKW